MTQSYKHSLASLLRPEFHRALCDPNRIAIVAWLAQQGGPRTVSEVASSGCCRVDLSVVSRHLSTLQAAGVLKSTRRGREVLYSFRASSVVRLLRTLADAIEGCCAVTSETKEEG